jgi:flagellar M-ring protein FliF
MSSSKLSGIADSVRSLLAGFTAGQKAVTGIAVLALLAGAVAFTSWAAKPAMVPVFTNLNSTDAAAITEELMTRGTAYELADGGASVLVPKQDVHQLRIDLSAAGLVKDGEEGWGLMDAQGITTSEFRQRVDYQRALEGELANTISSIDGVEAATVHLVIPEEKLFSEDARQPTASVLIKNRPGKAFESGKVQAVTNLVSSSVPGLDPERVTIADSKGNVLSGSVDGTPGLGAGDARAMQTAKFETELQSSVQEMLTPVVGAGKAIVRVKAELDFDKSETLSEIYGREGKEAPVEVEKGKTEEYEGTAAPIGGVLGPENSVLPDGNTSTYTREEMDRQRAIDKVTEKRVAAPGSVENLSVAVVLDAGAAGTVSPQEVEQLVVAATGIKRDRGDVVEVSRMTFDDSAEKAAEEEFAAIAAAEASAKRMSMVRTGVVLLVVVLLVLYALRTMRKDRRTEVELPYEVDVTQQALEAERLAALAAAERLALEPAMSGAEVKRLEIKGEIGELVERQPDEVAQLLRGWLADRRS